MILNGECKFRFCCIELPDVQFLICLNTFMNLFRSQSLQFKREKLSPRIRKQNNAASVITDICDMIQPIRILTINVNLNGSYSTHAKRIRVIPKKFPINNLKQLTLHGI